MKKLNYGWIGNKKGEKISFDIEQPPMTFLELLLCVIPFGGIYVAQKYFKKGADAYDNKQDEIFKKLGLLH